jgi:hypothetical protein
MMNQQLTAAAEQHFPDPDRQSGVRFDGKNSVGVLTKQVHRCAEVPKQKQQPSQRAAVAIATKSVANQ